jgi:hypothetical protein
MEILEELFNSDDVDWQEAERFWVAYLRFLGCRLTNLDGGGNSGKQVTEETRAKMSRKKLGKKFRLGCRHSAETIAAFRIARLGRRHTPEARAKMSATRRGKPTGFHPSLASRAKMRAAKIGKTLSQETRAKIGAAHRGRICTPETRAKLRAANSGKTLSLEHIAKLRAAKLQRRKRATETNPQWQDKGNP